MRILHTSDWHLGKLLYNYSRLSEQKQLIDELAELTDTHGIDLIIIAGDVYDVVNPPAAAEQLFYSAMKRLGGGGRRPVIIVAGNHDSPGRLTASSPLTTELGIIIFGTPGSVIEKGRCGDFTITASGPGYIELELGSGERAVIAAMPYPSDKHLNELLDINDEAKYRQDYSDRIGDIFAKRAQMFKPDTVNLAVGHFYVRGGEMSGSERDISLGGSYAVDKSALPQAAQYIALGHLHRPQRVGGLPAYYSGSPIAYDIGEGHTAKCVYIADISPGADAVVEKAYLRNYKPMVYIDAESADEAVRMIKEQPLECWLIIRIKARQALTLSEIKHIRAASGDILEIVCNAGSYSETQEAPSPYEAARSVTPGQLFTDFYTESRGCPPSNEITSLFLELTNTVNDGSA